MKSGGARREGVLSCFLLSEPNIEKLSDEWVSGLLQIVWRAILNYFSFMEYSDIVRNFYGTADIVRNDYAGHFETFRCV